MSVDPQESPRRPLLVIAGPTGIGKTALAVELAARFNGEVVSADSRQIYRLMDIGTAKPTAAERAAVPHHLIDIVDPDQTLTMAAYQARAYASINDIQQRGKLPLLVGGTGQYITAVLEGWIAPEVVPNPTLRAELEAYAAEHGALALFERLRALDPASGERMDPYNVRRNIRALEVCIETGQPFSEQRRKAPPSYHVLQLGLTTEREQLYKHLDERIDAMLEAGLLDEVRSLHERGYDWSLPSMHGLGYAQLGAFLRGETTLDEAVRLFKAATHTFVRRQYTWFRKYLQLRWLDVPADNAAHQIVSEWLMAVGTQ
ncbi:MAG: tRNA (adenosine(37)-N6)-dimethylallyltransferase MiaA [Anaerolineae bacterium]|nr:tRNA (adenosine(37)-N6)-dimethylallyltransferase MiaA [Anaerolineae bacterium]